jgi:hypothetical protein
MAQDGISLLLFGAERWKCEYLNIRNRLNHVRLAPSKLI